MKVDIEKVGGCRRVMRVDVSAADVRADYDALLGGYTKQVKIPGFREGKAPAALVEKRFSERLAEEAKDRLIPRFYQEAVQQEQIKPVAVLGVADVMFTKDTGLQFRVTIDVEPEFKLPKYEKLTVHGTEPVTTDADVDRAIDDLRGRFARYEDVEGRPVAAEDLVQVDYAGTLDGVSLSEVASDCLDLGKGEAFWVPVSEPEFLPGFNAGLIGAELGSTRTIDVAFPKDYHVAAVAGKTARYEVAVKGLRTRELPPVDAAFLERLQVEDEASLRKMVRENLEAGSKRAEEGRRRDEVINQLLAKSDFDIPESLVERHRDGILREMVSHAARQGVNREAMEGQRENMVKEADESANNRVRLSYILNAIAEQEKVVVSEEDLDLHIEQLAGYYQIPPARFRGEVEKNDSELENMRQEVRAGKVLDMILERAKLKIS